MNVPKFAMVLSVATACAVVPVLVAQKPTPKSAHKSVFDAAPAAARNAKDPYEGDRRAISAGRQVYARNCLACHGRTGEGTGNIPSLRVPEVKSAPPGAVFWFVTKGDLENGMPSWRDILSEKQRWQVVTYVKSLTGSRVGAAAETAPIEAAPAEPNLSKTISAPLPQGPFYDFRLEKPGQTHKLTVNEIPPPFATDSASNGPQLVKRPENVWPQAPAGFKVEQFASGLHNPRLLRTAPNGDIFLAESRPGEIKVFRGMTADGKPQQTETFATGLDEPFGIAFYPPGPDPKWVYVGNTNAVLRFPYKNGDLKATGGPQHLAELPTGGHWTRNLEFSADGSKLYVSVGSRSNVNDPDTDPSERDRATVLEFNPDGSGRRVYASGIRNCVGLARESKTNALWCSTNERDALGDNLVPDYITHIEPGGFYGWPWWYMGGHQDPRHEGKHPELKDKVITPDVLLQPHSASLQITFYDGKQFPSEYQGDIFAAEHGSWNRSIRVGYEVVRAPLHQTGKASGEYEDFLTGFVLPSGDVWGRPVGVTVAPDGSLLVSDDGSNSIWRVSYAGK